MWATHFLVWLLQTRNLGFQNSSGNHCTSTFRNLVNLELEGGRGRRTGGKGREVKHTKFNPPATTSSFPSYGPPIVSTVVLGSVVAIPSVRCTTALMNCMLSRRSLCRVHAVRRLWMQRAYAIQIDDQYTFCYKTMLQQLCSDISQAQSQESLKPRVVSVESLCIIMHCVCTHYLYGVFF